MPYAQWFNVARVAVEYQRKRGFQFASGVERQMALAAVAITDRHAAINALERALKSLITHDPFSPVCETGGGI